MHLILQGNCYRRNNLKIVKKMLGETKMYKTIGLGIQRSLWINIMKMPLILTESTKKHNSSTT